MNTRSRLDSISSTLANLFRQSAEPQRRRAALAACVVAVAQTGLCGEDVDAALELLCREDGDWSAARHNLSKLSEQFDKQYLDLFGAANQKMTAEALHCFRKARAASALAFGLSSSSEELHEAIYEAIVASERQAETLQATEIELRWSYGSYGDSAFK